jgi:hypothetical protein
MLADLFHGRAVGGAERMAFGRALRSPFLVGLILIGLTPGLADSFPGGLGINPQLTELEAEARGANTPAAVRNLVWRAAAAADQSLAEQQWSQAASLMDLASKLAKKARDPGLAKVASARAAEIQELTGLASKAAQAREKLTSDPEDVPAHERSGLFALLVEAEPAAGTAQLEKAAKRDLAEVAAAEKLLLDEESPEHLVRAAQAWWQYAQHSRDVTGKLAFHRALAYLRQASRGFTDFQAFPKPNPLKPMLVRWKRDAPMSALLGHWAFDDSSAGLVKNSAGSAAGTVHGAERVPSPFDSGLSFDGREDYVEFPMLDVGPEFTIALWINPAESDEDHQCLFSNTRAELRAGFGLALRGRGLGGRKLSWRTENLGGRHDLSSEGEVIQTGRWQHVAVTVNQNAARATLYLDGELLPAVGDMEEKFATAGKCRLGTYVFERLERKYTGQMDELRIYGRELLPCEIAVLAGSRGW